MTTKRQIITEAFNFIGLAAFVYDLLPEQWEAARRQLDSMMATWSARGIRVGFPVSLNPDDGDLDQDTGLPDGCREACYMELGKRLAPTYGKVVTPDQKSLARDAYQAMIGQLTRMPQMQMPGGFPLGAGHKRIDFPPFTPTPEDPILAGNDGPIDFS